MDGVRKARRKELNKEGRTLMKEGMNEIMKEVSNEGMKE